MDGDEGATRWIHNDRDDYVFSFVNCCRLAGIDPATVRRKLQYGQTEAMRRLLALL